MILDFGFWILDFGFWILDFGFWIASVHILKTAVSARASREQKRLKGLVVREARHQTG
jgi:hypothetical protein